MERHLHSLRAAVVCVVTLLSCGLSAPALTQGPASHWTFDESRGTIAHDSVGGHDGTLLGSPSFVPGLVGNAIRMSRATNDRIPIGNVYGTGAAFSVSLWIKLAPDAPGDNYPIGNHYTNVNNGWIVFTGVSGGCYGDPNRPSFYVSNNCNGEITAPVNVNDGAWHHLAATYTPGGLKTLHVDGGLVDASSAAGGYIAHPGAQLVIGGLVVAGVPKALFDGLIDDVQIYTRTLSCSEVQYLYLHPGEEVPSLPDLDGNGSVSGSDLAILLGAWGPCGASPCAADFDCSGSVDAADLAVLLGAWTS